MKHTTPSRYVIRKVLDPHLSASGQATVEYLVVGLACVVIFVALSVFSGRLEQGLFVEHAADSASHAVTTHTAGSVGDVLLY